MLKKVKFSLLDEVTSSTVAQFENKINLSASIKYENKCDVLCLLHPNLVLSSFENLH